MKGNQKFFKCRHCGNIAGLIDNKGIPMVCCGEKMSELAPNSAEASIEKHLPVVTNVKDGVTVQIGSIPHPMESAHSIAFIYVETERGGQRKSLKAGSEPNAVFSFTDDRPIAVYAYCNLHGLWKTEI
jgi:superoxide reductase